MDLIFLLNHVTDLFFIILGSTSGVFIRNLWLIQKKKLPRLDLVANLISSVASIFLTLIAKFFIDKQGVWTIDVYAGISFGVGLIASVLLDLLTDEGFLKRIIYRKAIEKEEKIDISVNQNDTEKKS